MKAPRGYTLVEIAIVLTVFLIMSSWLASSYYEFQKDRDIAESERSLALIKEALVEYAVRHRTRSFIALSLSPGATPGTTVTVRWRMPADRPYLPCPDITGDGLENRTAASTNENILVGSFIGLFGESRWGGCVRYKGLVPWQTLSTPPVDPWGNRFTYRVDPDFTSSLMGFDSQTTADDSFTSLTGLPTPDTRALGVGTSATGNTIVIKNHVLVPDEAIVVGTAPPAVFAIWGGAIRSQSAPSLICGSAPCSALSPASVSIHYGAVASVAVTLRVGGYAALEAPVFASFVAQNITDGLPVVVLSHGANGYGAARSDVDGLACNFMPPGHEDERQNAFWSQATASCPVVAPTDALARDNGFVVRDPTRAAATNEEFDDIVSWMSTTELAARLARRGVLPVDKLPPIGLEAY